MKGRWRKIICIFATVAVLAAGFLIVWLLQPAEPTYKGKSLSLWLEQMDGRNASEDARAALLDIGPRAVPFLLKRVRNEGSLSQQLYRSIWARLPKTAQQRLGQPGWTGRALYSRVAMGLSLVGPPALPQLISALTDPDSRVRLVAVGAVGLMGAEAQAPVRAVVPLTKDPDPEVQLTAAMTILRMGPVAAEAIPDLIPLLSDRTFWRFRGLFVTSLGAFGPEAAKAVPELRTLLSNADPDLRERSAMALWRITGDTNMIKVLTSELERTTDPQQSGRIMTDLGEIGPPARSAIPLILAKGYDPRPLHHRLPAVFDLGQISRKAANKIDPDALKASSKSGFKVLDLREAKLADDQNSK